MPVDLEKLAHAETYEMSNDIPEAKELVKQAIDEIVDLRAAAIDSELLLRAASHRSWTYSISRKTMLIKIYDEDTTRVVAGIDHRNGVPILNAEARSFLRAAIAAEEAD